MPNPDDFKTLRDHKSSETPDPLDNFFQEIEDNKVEALKPPSPVINMPVYMTKGGERIQVGEAMMIVGDDKLAVHLNSVSGREVAELLSSNLIGGITLGLAAERSIIAGLN